MHIADILEPQRILCQASLTSKKATLEALSKLLADADKTLSYGEIFDCLIAREKLGSTGLEHGIAIPHGKLQHNHKTLGAFIQLQEGIEYGAVDQRPVDLIFALIVPEHATDEHLDILPRLAKTLRSPKTRDKLRMASDVKTLHAILVGAQP